MTGAQLTRHGPGEHLARHRHANGYAAVVLRGGYVEAGDRGRFVAEVGHVVLHGPHESHQDAFSVRGALVLNLPIDYRGSPLARVPDPDTIACLAERDLRAACYLLRATLVEDRADLDDWVDQLGRHLVEDPTLDLRKWAHDFGIAPPSVSRGFRRAFGVTPKRFRADQRTLHALRALNSWHGNLAALAAQLGFADQAHMTRSIVRLTGKSPSRIRVNSIQELRRHPR